VATHGPERSSQSARPVDQLSPTIMIMTLGRRLRERVDGELRGQGLSLRHVSALGHLASSPGLSYSELARRAGVTAQSMQATLNQLEEIGAVERRTVPGRGRTAVLHITDRGAEVLGESRAVIASADARLAESVGAEHSVELAHLLLRALDDTGAD
jgi:DNA-binding MarR family transcriptional regulator